MVYCNRSREIFTVIEYCGYFNLRCCSSSDQARRVLASPHGQIRAERSSASLRAESLKLGLGISTWSCTVGWLNAGYLAYVLHSTLRCVGCVTALELFDHEDFRQTWYSCSRSLLTSELMRQRNLPGTRRSTVVVQALSLEYRPPCRQSSPRGTSRTRDCLSSIIASIASHGADYTPSIEAWLHISESRVFR